MELCSEIILCLWQILAVIEKTDTNLLLSALHQVVGEVEELLMTIKSGGCLSSSHIDALACCKY